MWKKLAGDAHIRRAVTCYGCILEIAKLGSIDRSLSSEPIIERYRLRLGTPCIISCE